MVTLFNKYTRRHQKSGRTGDDEVGLCAHLSLPPLPLAAR